MKKNFNLYRRTSIYAIDASQEKTAYYEFACNKSNGEPNYGDMIQIFHQKDNSIYIIEAIKIICICFKSVVSNVIPTVVTFTKKIAIF